MSRPVFTCFLALLKHGLYLGIVLLVHSSRELVGYQDQLIVLLLIPYCMSWREVGVENMKGF